MSVCDSCGQVVDEEAFHGTFKSAKRAVYIKKQSPEIRPRALHIRKTALAYVGLFCGYIGLFYGNVGLFCGYHAHSNVSWRRDVGGELGQKNKVGKMGEGGT